MKKVLLWLLLVQPIFINTGCEEAEKLLQNTGLTNEEVIQGLRSALNIGTDTSVNILSKVDGYYRDEIVKILLPQEAQNVYNVVAQIPGGQSLLDQTVLAINRAAEDAAPEAKSIFVNAISGITINDGFSILNGGDTAATVYLKDKTYNPLTAAFAPKIQTSLDKPLVLGVSAESAYGNLISAYNTASLGGILWAEIKTNSLSEHVTQKALDGLFIKVSTEEKNIRNNISHQVNDILRKVFKK